MFSRLSPNDQTNLAASPIKALVTSNVPYGRPDVIGSRVTEKQSWAEKLRTVLRRYASQILQFSWDETALPGLYWIKAEFRVDEIDEQQLIARLKCSRGNQSLLLYCSLHYFSDSPVRDGRIQFGSSNYIFFQECCPFTFESIFLLLSSDTHSVCGSPLFLKVPLQRQVIL
jgi:hypothetical protein